MKVFMGGLGEGLKVGKGKDTCRNISKTSVRKWKGGDKRDQSHVNRFWYVDFG